MADAIQRFFVVIQIFVDEDLKFPLMVVFMCILDHMDCVAGGSKILYAISRDRYEDSRFIGSFGSRSLHWFYEL